MGFTFSNLANDILIKKKLMGGFLSSVVDSTKQDFLSDESEELEHCQSLLNKMIEF